MRSLRERLAALEPRPARLVPPPLSGPPIEAVLTGRFVPTARGELFMVEQPRDDPEFWTLLDRAPLDPSLYLPGRSGLDPEEMVFLDTETTGLAGGTGTHAFLIGMGVFEGGQFVVRQFFMRHPAEEPALLDGLLETLSRYHVLVTFNGRAFDWPLIETRFVIHGHRPAFGLEHLDLLHPARRIWKHRLASCALASLEASLFGLRRDEDVPGFLIPQIYFDYLRDGDARRLRPVFAHNREDIVTMVRLTDLLLRAAATPGTTLPHPADQVGLGLLLLQRGEVVRGLETLNAALEWDELDGELRRRAEVEVTRWLKRIGRAPEAVPLWLAMCDRNARRHSLDLYPFEELAKYYEHEARDLDAAAHIVERALLLLELRGQQDGRQALLYRLERLTRRRANAPCVTLKRWNV